MADLFGNRRTPRWDPLDARVRALLGEAISKSGKTREQIAEELSACLGRSVSTRMLNDYCANCKMQSRFPAAWVEPFCTITGDDRLQLLVMGPRKRQLLEYAEREIAAVQDEQQRQALREELLATK